MAGQLLSITSSDQFVAAVDGYQGVTLLFLWTSWDEASKALRPMVAELALAHPALRVCDVEAERVELAAERFPQVECVPAFLFLQEGKVQDLLQGARSAPRLPELARTYARKSEESAAKREPRSSRRGLESAVPSKKKQRTGAEDSTGERTAAEQASLESRLLRLAALSPLMLFTQGASEGADCRPETRAVLAVLEALGVLFASFDVKLDTVVEQGLCKLAEDPHFPKIFLNGRLIGGLTELEALRDNGGLLNSLPSFCRQSKFDGGGCCQRPGNESAKGGCCGGGAGDHSQDRNQELGGCCQGILTSGMNQIMISAARQHTGVVFVSPDTAEGDTQGNHPPPKDLSSVFEEIAQQAQEQFELGCGEQTQKLPPISIPSDLELVSILDDARDNIIKESQVKPRAMMLRKRRIAKAKAIVEQLFGEAHGFTDAEVEEFTLQYMNLSEQLVFKPGDGQQAKIATQTLLHMDCNVMSDQQVTNLLRASQHPWLTGAKLVKQRKELTQEVIPKYGLEGSKDGKSAAADPNKLLQLEAGWRKNGASDVRQLCIPIGGDGSKLGANHSMVTWAMKCFALDQKRELVKGFHHPTTQEGIFPLRKCKCKEDLVELKQYAGEMLKTFESWEKDGWTSSATGACSRPLAAHPIFLERVVAFHLHFPLPAHNLWMLWLHRR
eukprot:g32365.t1